MAKNLFNSIQLTKPKKNVFDLSHDVKMSTVMGRLTPSLVMECVPGDSFNISCDSLVRFAPLLAPLMHRVDVYMHYFFVPNRLLWPNWEKYITNNAGGVLPLAPYLTYSAANAGHLPDYLGLPTPDPAGGVNDVSAMPFSAYQMIYNEYYRDQNLITAVPFALTDGSNFANEANLLTIRKRCWEHDYFTSALPGAQQSTPVGIPLGDVSLKDDWTVTGGIPFMADSLGAPAGASAITQTGVPNIQTGGVTTAYDPNGSLEVASTTINDLRRAFRLQEWLEKAMRGGSRYVENILNHFGVRSSDKRLQRPEYITGTKSAMVISEVLNTAGGEEAGQSPQGNMAGHGASVTSGSYGNYFCEEHGYIMGIMSVMPKTAYQDGIPKHFLKINDPFEYYWPSFAHIGEQAVINKEVMAFSSAGGYNENGTFGYVPRYAEYKFMQNRVAGNFRDTLDFWHLGRIFDPALPPALNSDFVTAFDGNEEAFDRIFAVQDGSDHLFAHILHKIRAIRAMPKFGSPSF